MRRASSSGIPDMRYINRHISVAEVARALDLRFGGVSKIHCWHPERHKHGDRTPSVGIRRTNNTLKCFGCDSKPAGPIDLVMDVREMSAADSALWIAERFEVPKIPAGKRIQEPARLRKRLGYGQGLELLIASGLWGTLSEPSRSVAPVLLELSEKEETTDQHSSIRISYVALSRYSGIKSPNAVRKALSELEEIGFIILPESGFGRSPQRRASLYLITPNSETLVELAHAFANQMRVEITAEREIRKRLRQDRIRALMIARGSLQCRAGQEGSSAAPLPHTPIPARNGDHDQSGPQNAVGTEYNPLYSWNSANQQNAIHGIARSSSAQLPWRRKDPDELAS